MSTSLYDLAVRSYQQTVASTAAVLAKGAEHAAEQGIDPKSLVGASIHPDMYPLHFQIVSVVHHSVGAVRAVESGGFGPPTGYPQMDYAGLQKFLADASADLEAVDASAFDGHAGGRVVFKLGEMEIPFTTENFVLSFSLPNFYFHATTAYDILREKGVGIGKMDFLGQMRIG